MKKPPKDPTLSAYRRALSAAVVTHARYLAVRHDKSATPHLVERRRQEWQRLEHCKASLQRRVAELASHQAWATHAPSRKPGTEETLWPTTLK